MGPFAKCLIGLFSCESDNLKLWWAPPRWRRSINHIHCSVITSNWASATLQGKNSRRNGRFLKKKSAQNCWKFIAQQFPHSNHYHQSIISTLNIVDEITTMQLLRGPIVKALQNRNRQNYESNQLYLCLSIAMVRGNLCDRCFCTNNGREKARMPEPWTDRQG